MQELGVFAALVFVVGADVGGAGEDFGQFGEGVFAIGVDEGASLQAFEFGAIRVGASFASDAAYEESVAPFGVGNLVD